MRGLLLAVVALVAGCAAPAATVPSPAPPVLEEMPADGIAGFELLATLPLSAQPYNLAVAGDLLVASLAPAGGPLAPGMGLAVVDVADPETPRLLATLTLPGGGVEAVALTDDARFAFVGTEFSGAVGIWTVDLADPRAPLLAGHTPILPEGPHNLRYAVLDGNPHVLASISHVSMAGTFGLVPQDSSPTHDLRVDLYRFDPTQPKAPLALVSSYQAEGTQGLPQDTPIVHDAVAQRHPVTGRDVMYVAYWDRGVRLVDVTNPASPVELGAMEDMAPAEFFIIHTVKPHPTLLDGRHYTVATSQCAYAPGADCYLRVIDTTDPSRPVQVAAVTLPGSPRGTDTTSEIFDLANGKLVVPWLVSGVWRFDLAAPEAPRAVGYDLGGRTPNAVVLRGDVAFVADIDAGLRVLRLA